MVNINNLIEIKEKEIERLKNDIKELRKNSVDYTNKWVFIDKDTLMFVRETKGNEIYGDSFLLSGNDLVFESDDWFSISDRIEEISKEKALELVTTSIENLKEKVLRRLKLNQ